MTKLFNHQRQKYLILLPMLFLVLNALYFRHATRVIGDTMLQEKYLEVLRATEMLAAAVEAKPERTWYNHEQNIIDSVEYLDKLYQVYGGTYKTVNGELVLITERFYETSIFEPMGFTEFTEAVFSQESGDLIIGYTPENQTYRELHVYYRWMPLYSPKGERFLVVMKPIFLML